MKMFLTFIVFIFLASCAHWTPLTDQEREDILKEHNHPHHESDR